MMVYAWYNHSGVFFVIDINGSLLDLFQL